MGLSNRRRNNSGRHLALTIAASAAILSVTILIWAVIATRGALASDIQEVPLGSTAPGASTETSTTTETVAATTTGVSSEKLSATQKEDLHDPAVNPGGMLRERVAPNRGPYQKPKLPPDLS